MHARNKWETAYLWLAQQKPDIFHQQLSAQSPEHKKMTVIDKISNFTVWYVHISYTAKDTAASYLPNVSDHDCCQSTSLEN